MLNLPALLAASKAYQNLTPAQRALLKGLEGLLIGAVIAALTVVVEYLALPGSVNWSKILVAAFVAFATSVGMGLAKYLKAQGDPQLNTLGTLVEQGMQEVAANQGGAPLPNDSRGTNEVPSDVPPPEVIGSPAQ